MVTTVNNLYAPFQSNPNTYNNSHKFLQKFMNSRNQSRPNQRNKWGYNNYFVNISKHHNNNYTRRNNGIDGCAHISIQLILAEIKTKETKSHLHGKRFVSVGSCPLTHFGKSRSNIGRKSEKVN